MSAAEATGLSGGGPAHPREAAALPALERPRGVLAASARLLRSELRLILGRRRNQAGLLVLASVPIMIAIAIRAEGPGEGDGGPGLISAVTSNGVFVALTALTVEIALFLPLAVAVLSGDAIAGEANLGTLRGLLAVPVSRTRLLAVKYASLTIGALIGVLVVVGTGLVVGGALLGLGPTTLLSGTQVPLAEALLRVGIAAAYIAAGLAALAAIGLFVSTLTEQPIAATITTTVVATAMWILTTIPQLDWLHPWLLVQRWPAFADAFRDPVFWDTMRTGLLVDVGYAAVFLALAWARFSNKDVTS
ncbi:MAG: ABC transporter permease subunit [Candidatus Nanopelagicales bacterium]|jgi:ABC-2 type transport system permease protein|nr:ABC transporter permease subunit [Candidatus Nanopelagicales bacterium]